MHRSIRGSGPYVRARLAAACLALLCGAASAQSTEGFDALSRTAAARDAAGSAPRIDASALRRLDVHGHHDERLGVPNFLWVGDASPARAVSARGADPVRAARDQLRTLAPLYRLSDAEIDALEAYDRQTMPGGAQLVRLRQRIDGIDVFRDSMTLLSDADGRLTAVSGYLLGDTRSRRDASTAAHGFVLDAQDAIARVLDDHGLDGAPLAAALQAQTLRADAGGYTRYTLPVPAQTGDALRVLQPPRVKPVWFRMPEGLVPAWYVESEVDTVAGAHWLAHVISAKDGSLLFRKDLVAEAAFTYRVWAETGGDFRPYNGPVARTWHPHPTGTPDNTQPPFIAPALVTLQNAPFSENDPWLADGATETRGNNVDAFANITAPDDYNVGDIRAAATAPGTFDRTYNVAQAPNTNTDQIQAAVTQLFYVNNWLHDAYYDAGFDEAAGNAQVDNFGRGGIGGDDIRAQGQDYASTSNANMATPADGARPRMRMYVFPVGGEVTRDGTIDNAIVAHEWGHYISNRLIGNAAGLSNLQGGGMGEGWGDFHSLLMTVVPETGPNAYTGAYSVAGYATGRLAPNNSFYYGIRRYPYSTNLNINPLSFRHIQNGVALPVGPPRAFTGTNSSVHNTGEVWASMLWECYSGLLRDSTRLSFDEAQARMKSYVVAGYKMTPNAPTFVEARDGVLAAIAAQSQEDFAICVAGFAKRGAGFGAVAPGREAAGNIGVIESTSTQGYAMAFGDATLDDQPGYCDLDGILDGGETGTLAVHLRNTGFSALAATDLTVSSSSPGVSFPQGNVLPVSDSGPLGAAQALVPIAYAPTGGIDVIDLDLSWDDPQLDAPGNASVQFRVNFDTVPQSSATDDAESPAMAWETRLEVTADDTFRWQRTEISPSEHRFLGRDNASTGLSSLVSPPLQVSTDTPFVITFQHRHQFESGSGVHWDGGIVELSTDDGASWIDIGPSAVPTYNGVLTDQSNNPIETRSAYVNTSTGYPAMSPVTIDLGSTYAGQTVRVRFAVGTDEAVGAAGWELDNLVFAGIDNTPFPTIVPQRDFCADAEIVAGDGQITLVGTPFASGLTVQVSDAQGAPIAGTPVQFAAPSSGASATFPGDVTTLQVPTDGNGVASTPVPVANATAGLYDVVATFGSRSVAIALGNVAPAPGTPDLLPAFDSGNVDDDDITNADPAQFDVVCVDGSTISLRADGVPAGSGAACSGGSATVAASLPEGALAITAVATVGGVDSAASAPLALTVDRSANAPTLAADGAGSPTPTLTGVAEAGAAVTVYDAGVPVCTAVADGAGDWTCVASLDGDGVHALRAGQTDVAGNTSALSDALDLAVGPEIFADGFESD
ncbi:M36 family metallopeptidase [Chiayiivirga flava]|uniref:Bacterial Ig-like domain-containing protein n=1 Tax=Chiayiivirga flava TaxID=659595 RepID=A0A7W8G1T5_9GAMM|nr:M36 family metallopeptidase [Chiayiivirga flava]MBB5207980.1 hypothetical protein [Chiayiivirga flava]